MRILSVLLIVVSGTLFAQIDGQKTFQDEYDAWFKTHPLPAANASPEQRLAFYGQVAEASAVWVRHWPDDPRAWLQRFKSLAKLKSTPDQKLEETGDAVLKAAKQHPSRGFRFVPFQTTVAEVWTERHIRPEQTLQLTQEAVREDERAESDNPSAAREFMPMVAQGLFKTLSLQISVATQLKKLDIAESALVHMRQYLETHQVQPVTRGRLEHWYLEEAASLAALEGHKPDALLYYSEAFQKSSEDSSAETHAHQLWKDLGGTEEGFNDWVSTIARIQGTPPATNEDHSPWTPMNKQLTEFRGVDKGKVWTIEDLKGKITLINVWATWCRPCQDELPSIQSMFDQLKDRKDVQVLTINVDEDITWVARFAQRQHYTFPVIEMTFAAVDKMVGVAGIPRTWIVDATGNVRFEVIGYDRALWPKQVLQQLESVKQKRLRG